MSELKLIIELIMGHALADFAFQSEWMANHKNRHHAPSFEPGTTTWPLVMTAHALINGLLVLLITRNIWLGLAETVCHWLIDWGKTESIYGVYPDQALHIACKITWASFI